MTRESITKMLPDPTAPGSAWPAYDYAIEADGIYFLDNACSDVASVALRRLLDAALESGERVVVEEL